MCELCKDECFMVENNKLRETMLHDQQARAKAERDLHDALLQVGECTSKLRRMTALAEERQDKLDAANRLIEGVKNRLKQIIESEDTTRLPAEKILMGYNAHKDLARAALSELQYPQRPKCACAIANGMVTNRGSCPVHSQDAEKRVVSPQIEDHPFGCRCQDDVPGICHVVRISGKHCGQPLPCPSH